ncbi:efflux RND transporter periplasmic adaptor subunit [Bacillus sp. FSL L8-0167]|nr:efflux RND transporter periplasmic adaptor subunit [Bacillus safensis]KKD40674.1 hypothetical protein KU48_14985 [Bacillus safensis]MCM3451611.1 efflux RND transporter periplasmic adaptor subunit [Bacillus safensis]MDR6683975.1 HlyD family secretion protein [Bacillus safensis]MEC0950142.1 efflux RND transporter periplasmic adaptor subunit [Bacillus safensis]MED5092918.1 efflux RND transporter periplasmic adaptor subunit [Bacillus safensis]
MNTKFQTEIKKNNKLVFFVIIIIILVFIFFLAAINIYMSKNQGKEGKVPYKFTKITTKNFDETQLLSGIVKPKNTASYFIENNKNEILVKNGDYVEEGQKILEYNKDEFKRELEKLSIENQKISRNLQIINKNIEMLNSKLKKNDEKNPVYDQLKKELDENKHQKEILSLDLKSNESSRNDKINDLNNSTINAGIPGYIQLKKDETNKIIAIYIMSKGLIVESQVTELQKPSIRKKDRVKITSKVMKDKSWSGKVIEISDFPNENTIEIKSNLSEYSMKVSIDSAENLLNGYHVILEIITSKEKLNVVPIKSLIKTGKTSYVFVLNKDKLVKKEVKVKYTDQHWAEITGGLNDTDEVLENPSSQTREGEKVK